MEGLHTVTRGLVATLGLTPHPEGGYFRETVRSPLVLTGLPHGAPRAAHTAIYYLLPEGVFSPWHRVRSDEVWHFYAGAPVELHLLHDDGTHAVHRLGPVQEGQRPQALAPAGVWQAARVLGAPHALCGCTVAPGFEFADFEMPSRQELVQRFPAQAELVAAFTR